MVFGWVLAMVLIANSEAYEIRFEDSTRKAGLPDAAHHFYGASWGYLNGDRYPDLYIPLHERSDKGVLLFVNNKGKAFKERPDLVRLNHPKEGLDLHGASWGNFFSKDPGRQDIYQSVGGRRGIEELRATIPSIFFVNDRGRLVNVAEQKKIRDILQKGPLLRGRTALPVDFDNDGRLDLLLTGFGGSPFRLLKNTGEAFVDVSIETGVSNVSGLKRGWKAAAADLNDDRFSDLILGSGKVYRNEKGTAFKEEALSGAVKEVSHVAAADMNNDGLPDLFLLGKDAGRSVLLMRDGASNSYNGTPMKWPDVHGKGVQVNTGDFDNDGNEDLLIVTPDKLYLFQNSGNGVFTDVTESSGVNRILNTGRKGEFACAAFADYDLDGKLDIIVIKGHGGFENAKSERGPIILARNTSSAGHYLRLMLKGTKSNPQGLGAKVIVKTEKKQIVRHVTNGISATCQNDTVLHIGLDRAEAADVEVLWPSGYKTLREHLRADRIVEIVEGE
jgi:hypothetical protein